MLSWLNKKSTKSGPDDELVSVPDDKFEQALKKIRTVVSAYGELLEKHPASILDVSLLPIPKSKMKEALRVAWETAADAHEQNALEAGYVELSRFQDGVGPDPISLDVPSGSSPEDVLKTLDPTTMELQQKSLEEAKAFFAEFDGFKSQG